MLPKIQVIYRKTYSNNMQIPVNNAELHVNLCKIMLSWMTLQLLSTKI